MNYKKLGKILGKVMILEGALMLAPLIVSLVYREGSKNALAFAIPIAILVMLGLVLQLPKPKREGLYQKEGFALVALVWLTMAVFGALPFVISGDIPNYIDALFEITSGFTTTGASIVTDVTALAHSTLFWRSFSHWIGGMGILVFVLIFIPESKDGSAMHLLRAESPGPQVGKIVSKMKVTTTILYLIYLGLTVLQVIFLMFDKPITGYENEKFFFSLLAAFGCAGTGGFSFLPGSMEMFSPYSQYVMATFLILYGCNFGLYYLLLIGKVKEIFRSEELRTYILVVVVAVALVFVSLVAKIEQFPQTYTTEEAFRHSFFQVASIITTAGFSTTDFNVWPVLAVGTLTILMFMGGMAGSTAGGIKTSRIIMASKGSYIKIRKLINPRYVPKA
ncbi:MAG: TrkH family potassium uptake protein [Clostridia bacterium]|nr:TrkH family potassium uptake protein [Clostridia bacterium]